MHIVQLTHSLAVAYGGPAFNSFGLNRGLNAQPGISATIISMRTPAAERVDASFVTPDDAGVGHGVPTRGRACDRRALLSELRAADVVVMHGWFAEWLLPAAVLCGLLGVPYVVTPHGALGVHRRGVSRGRKRVYEALAGWFVRSRAHGFVVGSEVERTEILQVHPRLSVQVGGAGTDVWTAARSHGPHVPARLVSISRLAPKKRVDVSIRALAILRGMGIDAVLEVAGEGPEPLLASLHQEAERLGVDGSVAFLGGVYGAAKEDLLAAADVFVLPSEDENFGIAFVEALAHSLPCVVTKAVAAADGLDARAVIVIDEPCAEELALAVARLLGESADFGAARTQAHREAVERFTWRAAARHWVRLLVAVGPARPTSR